MPEFEWRGKNTWRQISTNVPPETLKVLRQVIAKNKTSMSQLLREVIDESPLMQYGITPRPHWATELNESIDALREEIADLRAEVAAVATAQQAKPEPDNDVLQPDLTKQIADLKQELLVVHEQTKARLNEFEVTALSSPAFNDVKPASTWPRLIGRLSQVFQFPRRKPAPAPTPVTEEPELLEVG